MKNLSKIVLPAIWCLLLTRVLAQSDTSSVHYSWEGQASAFLLFNPDNQLNTWLGARYIPAFNLQKKLKKKHLLDLEVSANLSGSFGWQPFDSTFTDGSLRAYRAWVRYSNQQMEWRLGLQKINFGSASILRPLMWFDQIDPRDPLQITDGVWGLLGRYYFLNNANLWVWGLYGNDNIRGWEVIPANANIPEFGARFQFPVKFGEVGLSFHHRNADVSKIGAFDFEDTAENKMALDGKWDLVVGFWIEGSWVRKTRDLGLLTNQTVLNLGADYTFGLGGALTVVAEQLFFSFDEKPFAFVNRTAFTALSMTYPLGLFDNLTAIIYYDWTNDKLFNFLQWQHSFPAWSLHVMGFWNPADDRLPQQGNVENLFGGKGIQVLAVYNH